MPDITWAPPVGDLISNFTHNWGTLMPVLVLLFGILFGTFVIRKVYKHLKGDGDD